MNKNDRRSKRTEKALSKALTQLLQNKQIRDITIKELTDTADIHRATFYTHYEDIFDLYKQIEDSVINELYNMINKMPSHNYEETYKSVIDYIYNNLDVFSMLLGKNSSHSFTDRFCQMLKEKYMEISKYESGGEEAPLVWNAIVEYHIRGYVAVITMLIRNNTLPEKEKLIELIYKIDLQIDPIMDDYIKGNEA